MRRVMFDFGALSRRWLVGLACPVVLLGLVASACSRDDPSGTPAASSSRPEPQPRPAPPADAARVEAAAPEYVGRETCEGCHPAEGLAWRGSDHDRAMEVASPESVQGDFDDARFEHFGVTTRFHRAGEHYRVETEGPAGTRANYGVKYTFGIRPLQQYLLETEAGRLQPLTVAWDTGAQRWFSLYPDERIAHDDALHWSGRGQNWNRNCASCHSTGVSVNYDAESERYRTSWSELDVSCEACHGQGSHHVTWAEAGAKEPAGGDRGPRGLVVGLERALPLARDIGAQQAELEVCAPCHARRSVVYPGAEPGSRFLDHFRPQRLTEGFYFADGQIRDEVFVYGSFLQSRMYAEGVRCTHCHDPHSARLVAEGNALCGQCHDLVRYDGASHHHHAEGSPGAQCVSCHMVARTYMGVDARRDHGFHLPRPDLSEELGVPNACGGCHGDRGDPAAGAESSAAWAAAWIERWFGPDRPDDRHAARTLAAGRAGAVGAAEALAALAANADRPGIVRATAFELLARYRPTPAFLPAARAGLEDVDPLVRASALTSLAALPPEEVVGLAAPRLVDPLRTVRMEAARVLTPGVAYLPRSDQALLRRYGAALEEYLEGQGALADWPEAHLNLAVMHQQLGRPDWAQQAYESAIALDPAFVPAQYNLALLYDGLKQPVEAEAKLREVIELAPEFADAHYSLGLLIAADPGRMPEAAVALERAAALAPQRARVLYNAGIAQQTLGRPEAAEQHFRAAMAQEPDEPDFAVALAILYLQQDRREDARVVVRSLAERAPDDPSVQALLSDLEPGAAPASSP